MPKKDKKTCIHCGRDNSQVPLFVFRYQGKKFRICTEHLPVLLHKPQDLAGKLPDVENLRGVDD